MGGRQPSPSRCGSGRPAKGACPTIARSLDTSAICVKCVQLITHVGMTQWAVTLQQAKSWSAAGMPCNDVSLRDISQRHHARGLNRRQRHADAHEDCQDQTDSRRMLHDRASSQPAGDGDTGDTDVVRRRGSYNRSSIAPGVPYSVAKTGAGPSFPVIERMSNGPSFAPLMPGEPAGIPCNAMPLSGGLSLSSRFIAATGTCPSMT
jgi:hypothetical protein